ncbi:MAG TPA: MotA/TolQ/ExbB proton channel family protein [Saprospiraceae bacterium]|nr:MotA/TolQ/ExbB proton channel family protein [Saprospiraceae bacterium]HRO07817.1 MotA/TolQ/ExbB proton channel family protein [Saprospiraceae bacterium]HRP41215.1 MotA/TolQ/ExbB proton channel family protein [Saprospiraceae bacterium]
MSFILQAAAAVDTTGVSSSDSGFSVLDVIAKGGIVMWPLLILSVISIYYIVERYLYIKKRSKIDSNLVKSVLDKVYNGQMDSASLICEQNSTSLGNVLKAGVDTLGKPIEQVKEALTVQSNIELSTMESRMGYISIISGIAPRLGFVGTIIGVIVIFYSIGQTADISISTISNGLYQKMITSGTGLIVGMVAFLGYNYLLTMVDNFSLYLQKEVLEFIKGINRPV